MFYTLTKLFYNIITCVYDVKISLAGLGPARAAHEPPKKGEGGVDPKSVALNLGGLTKYSSDWCYSCTFPYGCDQKP